jgi:hypothetical protein
MHTFEFRCSDGCERQEVRTNLWWLGGLGLGSSLSNRPSGRRVAPEPSGLLAAGVVRRTLLVESGRGLVVVVCVTLPPAWDAAADMMRKQIKSL